MEKTHWCLVHPYIWITLMLFSIYTNAHYCCLFRVYCNYPICFNVFSVFIVTVRPRVCCFGVRPPLCLLIWSMEVSVAPPLIACEKQHFVGGWCCSVTKIYWEMMVSCGIDFTHCSHTVDNEDSALLRCSFDPWPQPDVRVSFYRSVFLS